MSTLTELLPFLQSVAREEYYEAGHVLIHQGHHDQKIFYIIEGKVEVTKDGSDLGEIGAADVVGEYAFIDNRPRSATVRALTPLRVLMLEREAMLKRGSTDIVSLNQFITFITQRMQTRLQAQPQESSEAFLDRLLNEALSHRAVNHPYLKALASGDLPDMHWALADFGRQYYGYSAHFPRYLTKTISQLTNPAHRSALMENLTEESGSYHEDDLAELEGIGIKPEWILGIPHPELFKRFCDALGLSLNNVEEDQLEVVCWREMFLDVLGEGSPAQAIGALGLGTESVVSTMYKNFLPALAQLDLPPADIVFFPLHATVDDHHQATLLEIASDFASTPEGRHDLLKGMRKALFLRAGFWDWMYSRAKDPASAT